nr:hypothetical protein [Tanacetum cinerariifolium]
MASHIRSPELGPPAIQATIDETPYTITEDLVRSQLHLADDGGIDDLPIAEIYSGIDNLSPLVVALICLSDGRQFNWSSYIFKGMVSNIGNAKKFLMYPRFLQTILGIETSIKRQYQVLKFSSKLFANMKLNFEDHPMQLLAAMLFQDQEGEGAGTQILLPSLELMRLMMALSLMWKMNLWEALSICLHQGPLKLPLQVKAMEVKLRTTKKKMVVSDSDQEEGGKQDVDLDALLALANVAVTVDSNIPPGGASNNPTASTSVPVDVPTSAKVPTGSTSVRADVPTSVAPADRQRADLQRKRQQEVLALPMYYTEADWINIMGQVEANASFSKTRLGDDFSESNFPARMAALIKRKKQALAEKLAKERKDRPMTQGQQKTYMRQFVKNQSCAVYSTRWSMAHIQAFSMTLKRTCLVLEEPSSKRQKSTEAPISFVHEVPQSPVVSLPKSFGTRRKSLGRNHLTKPKSKLKELYLDADDQTFIKVVSNDSEDEAPLLWSALVGWEVITTPLGDINALYRIDWSTAHFTTLRDILRDLQVLFDSHKGDVSYPFLVKLMERMLTHKLEIDKDVVGNDMTTAEQLIQFIKNQLAAAQVSSA